MPQPAARWPARNAPPLPGTLVGRQPAPRSRWGAWLLQALQWVVIWVPLLISAGHVVLFTLWTSWISFTPSTLLPESGWVGLRNYQAVMATRNWQTAYANLFVFGIGFVALATLTGLLLAVLLDQRVRGENVLRTVFLYPMAVSFVVTGTVWGWLLNPGLGIPHLVRNLGWTGFRFDWLVDRDRAIYTVVIAGVWQASGFAMALFLAGLRSVDGDLIKAAQIDGAGPWRIYGRVVLPSLGPILVAVLVILLQFAIKTFDLVRALTGGGLASPHPPLVAADPDRDRDLAVHRDRERVPLRRHLHFGHAAARHRRADRAQHEPFGRAAVLIAALPTLLVHLFGGKYFIRGLTTGAVK